MFSHWFGLTSLWRAMIVWMSDSPNLAVNRNGFFFWRVGQRLCIEKIVILETKPIPRGIGREIYIQLSLFVGSKVVSESGMIQKKIWVTVFWLRWFNLKKWYLTTRFWRAARRCHEPWKTELYRIQEYIGLQNQNICIQTQLGHLLSCETLCKLLNLKTHFITWDKLRKMYQWNGIFSFYQANFIKKLRRN